MLIVDSYRGESAGHFPEFTANIFSIFGRSNISAKYLEWRNCFSAFRKGIVFINFNIGNRNELWQHFLLLTCWLIGIKAIVIVHSFSKHVLINRIIMGLVKDGVVFSRGFFVYCKQNSINAQNFRLAQFPNSQLSAVTVNPKKMQPSARKKIIVWGNANARNFCINKFIQHVDPQWSEVRLATGCHHHAANLQSNGFYVDLIDTESKSKLDYELRDCDYFSMVFDDGYDYYEKKINASAVLLTSLNAGLLGIIDFRCGFLINDILHSGHNHKIFSHEVRFYDACASAIVLHELDELLCAR